MGPLSPLTVDSAMTSGSWRSSDSSTCCGVMSASGCGTASGCHGRTTSRTGAVSISAPFRPLPGSVRASVATNAVAAASSPKTSVRPRQRASTDRIARVASRCADGAARNASSECSGFDIGPQPIGQVGGAAALRFTRRRRRAAGSEVAPRPPTRPRSPTRRTVARPRAAPRRRPATPPVGRGGDRPSPRVSRSRDRCTCWRPRGCSPSRSIDARKRCAVPWNNTGGGVVAASPRSMSTEWPWLARTRVPSGLSTKRCLSLLWTMAAIVVADSGVRVFADSRTRSSIMAQPPASSCSPIESGRCRSR